MFVYYMQLIFFLILDDITKQTNQILQAMNQTYCSTCTHHFRIWLWYILSCFSYIGQQSYRHYLDDNTDIKILYHNELIEYCFWKCTVTATRSSNELTILEWDLKPQTNKNLRHLDVTRSRKVYMFFWNS